MGWKNKARLAVCSKVIVKPECFVLVFFSRLDGYNQTLLLGGSVTVIACYFDRPRDVTSAQRY